MYLKRQLSDGKSRLSPKRDLAKLNRGSMECSGFTKHGGDDEIATIKREKNDHNKLGKMRLISGTH